MLLHVSRDWKTTCSPKHGESHLADRPLLLLCLDFVLLSASMQYPHVYVAAIDSADLMLSIWPRRRCHRRQPQPVRWRSHTVDSNLWVSVEGVLDDVFLKTVP
ncbi:hypothetical protein LY76DRAFT_591987 [Colletotrichum caudatum]|nr:hypothetical protein LY76DRAFT_591987 [Colletotrichum caudatum]